MNAQEQFYGTWYIYDVDFKQGQKSIKDQHMLKLFIDQNGPRQLYKWTFSKDSMFVDQQTGTSCKAISWLSDASYAVINSRDTVLTRYLELLNKNEIKGYLDYDNDVIYYRKVQN